MPLILNGSTLLKNTSGGLATTTACCCGQNPEGCFCPDPCAYITSIVLSSLSASDAAFSGCALPFFVQNSSGGGSLSQSVVTVYPLANTAFADIAATAFVELQQSIGVKPVPPWPGLTNTAEIVVQGFLDINAGLSCSSADFSQEQRKTVFVVKAQWSILVDAYAVTRGPNGNIDYRFLLARRSAYKVRDPLFPLGPRGIELTVPAVCEHALAKHYCSLVNPESLGKSALATLPISAAISDSAVNGVAWGGEVLSEFGPDGFDWHGWFAEAGVEDALRAQSATVTWSRRPSCRPVDCNCGVDLSGMKSVFDGKEFTVGQTDEQTAISGDSGEFEEYWSHYESAGIYYFVYERWLGPGKLLLYERRAATLFCDNDEESSPTVQRWYVEFEMTCKTYDGTFTLIEETTKTEIGYYNCELGEFCSGLAGDQPVPTGSPLEIEEAPGSPETTDGLNSCTPPARPSLTLSCQ